MFVSGNPPLLSRGYGIRYRDRTRSLRDGLHGEGSYIKAKGRFLFRDLAPCFPIFRRSGSAPRSQLLVTSELSGAFERSPRFPYSSVIPFAVRAFLVHP